MQQSPYGNYQQPYLGQQSFGTQNYNQYGNQGPYNFNWGGGGAQNPYGGYQQPVQGNGYWNQPSQAYGGYSMYGNTW